MTQSSTVDAVVLQALKQRRSVARLKADLPPRELIDQVLQAAVYAPNHHKTNPWRFYVLSGNGRERFGDIMAEDARKTAVGDDQAIEAAVAKARGKSVRAPVIIVSACVPSDGPKVLEIEEICAVAAATENMLIAAEALGLGAIWRTGAPAQSPAVRSFFGLPESAHIVGFVYLGYPDMPELPDRHREWAPYATWLD